MLKALVIDDDKLICWSIKEIFLQEGHAIDTVDCAEKALRMAEQSDYHLIFADLEAKEFNGVDMLNRIQKMQPKAKIIILSAQAMSQLQPEFAGLSVFRFIEKPFDSEQIRAIAKESLEFT